MRKTGVHFFISYLFGIKLLKQTSLIVIQQYNTLVKHKMNLFLRIYLKMYQNCPKCLYDC